MTMNPVNERYDATLLIIQRLVDHHFQEAARHTSLELNANIVGHQPRLFAETVGVQSTRSASVWMKIFSKLKELIRFSLLGRDLPIDIVLDGKKSVGAAVFDLVATHRLQGDLRWVSEAYLRIHESMADLQQNYEAEALGWVANERLANTAAVSRALFNDNTHKVLQVCGNDMLYDIANNDALFVGASSELNCIQLVCSDGSVPNFASGASRGLGSPIGGTLQSFVGQRCHVPMSCPAIDPGFSELTPTSARWLIKVGPREHERLTRGVALKTNQNILDTSKSDGCSYVEGAHHTLNVLWLTCVTHAMARSEVRSLDRVGWSSRRAETISEITSFLGHSVFDGSSRCGEGRKVFAFDSGSFALAADAVCYELEDVWIDGICEIPASKARDVFYGSAGLRDLATLQGNILPSEWEGDAKRLTSEELAWTREALESWNGEALVWTRDELNMQSKGFAMRFIEKDEQNGNSEQLISTSRVAAAFSGRKITMRRPFVQIFGVTTKASSR
jgi:hypothetical protein